MTEQQNPTAATPAPVHFSISLMVKLHDAAMERLEPFLNLEEISVLDDLRAAVSPIKIAILDHLLDQALSGMKS